MNSAVLLKGPVDLAAGCQEPGVFQGMDLYEEWVRNFFPRAADSLCRGMGAVGFPDWLIFAVLALLTSAIVLTIAALSVPYMVLLERRLLGRFQHRWGPNRVGKFGLLQPIADALKLMTKEDITPRAADAIVFSLAPIAFAAPVLTVFAVIPWAAHTTIANLDVGVLFAVAISTVGEMGVFMAGWASNNRYSLFGAMRSVAMLVSYEFPLLLSVGALALLAGSLNLSRIVDAQHAVPFILFQPLGFLIFVTAISAELNRPPFDLMEAESELVTGFHTEYSGMKWAVVQLAEYAGIIAFSLVIATVFLGGWQGPVLPGYFWITAKAMAVIATFVWVRATLPRLRVDQIMKLGWMFLLPLAMINLLVTGAEALAFPAGLPLWLIPVNFGLTALAIFLGARMLRFHGETRQVIHPGRPVITHGPSAPWTQSANAPVGTPTSEAVRP